MNKLSEEEIIKDVVEIAELAKEEIQNNDENITVILDLQDLKSLKGLLDLYQKEKEDNKKLKYEIDLDSESERYLNNQIKDLSKENEILKDIINKEHEVNLDKRYVEKNYISKDKIKAKIEPKLQELEKEINHEWKKYGNSKELLDMEDMYNFLQELLEEGEEK